MFGKGSFPHPKGSGDSGVQGYYRPPLKMYIASRLHIAMVQGYKYADGKWYPFADNARCVRGVIECITDPEVIDSAIRVGELIRWFDGGSDNNPPYDMILSRVMFVPAMVMI